MVAYAKNTASVKLSFSTNNMKLEKLEKVLDRRVAAFNLRAGYTCPAANICRSQVIETKEGLRICDGKNCEFRCYAASGEARRPNVYYCHKTNEKIVDIACKSPKQAAKIIEENLPKNIDIIRIHSSGDFPKLSYFKAWLLVAENNPHITFYCYTKMIPFILKYRKWIKQLDNFRITASYGGKYDKLIGRHRINYCKVVKDEREAKKLKLPIDKNDKLCYDGKRSFALLLHGTQPAKE